MSERCLHNEVCKYGDKRSNGMYCAEEKCKQFKNSTKYVEVVRCKDCKRFKPAHFKADDGTETPWDETFSFDDRTDGIYHGGKCKHERNTAYGEKDMAFRKPDDFCSYGERREGE